jgi:hypothetical protein
LETPVANTKTSSAERAVNGRIGGIKSQSLEQQAQRIVKHWPELTASQKSTIATMLRPVVGGSNG